MSDLTPILVRYVSHPLSVLLNVSLTLMQVSILLSDIMVIYLLFVYTKNTWVHSVSVSVTLSVSNKFVCLLHWFVLDIELWTWMSWLLTLGIFTLNLFYLKPKLSLHANFANSYCKFRLSHDYMLLLWSFGLSLVKSSTFCYYQ